jgi:hypothetical protein
MMDLGGSVAGSWLGSSRRRSSMSGSTSRRRGEAERKVTDVALLGRLDRSLEVACCLLCEERGREER